MDADVTKILNLIILLTYLYSLIPLLKISAQLIGFQNCGLNFKNKKQWKICILLDG